jgi:uncharacterized delta-60 repeat protein
MRKLLLCFCIIYISFLKGIAQPGFLDNSFGVNGIALSPFVTNLSYGRAMALQPDGKILVTGEKLVGTYLKAFVVRYNSDGSFDGNFTNLVTGIGPFWEFGRAIALQNDSLIVVAGDFNNPSFNLDYLLLRLNPSGTYDTSFGNGGIVTTGFAPNSIDETKALALQPDGKIVIAGVTANPDRDVALLRFNFDGSIDTTFGINGKVFTDINNENQQANAIALQPDGKIIVAGFSFTIATGNDLAVFRYHPNGALDTSFGVNGIAIPGINADDDAGLALSLQNDGKIVIAGYTYTNFTFADNLIVRLDSTGIPDTSFNSSGIVIINNSSNENISTGVIIQPDHKIVTSGRALQSSLDFSLSRFNSNGVIDSTFGNNGHVFTDIALEDDESFASLMQPDGKIVLTGYYSDSGIENFLVCRYLNDSILTGINNFQGMEITIFPQPANDQLHIKFQYNPGRIYLELYSMASKLLYSGVSDNSLTTLNLASISPGVLFLRITDQKKNLLTSKVFVKM